jgi:N-acetylmuramoyl-L-alanine amidase
MIRTPVILIDAGHGKDTPGKCSPDALAGKNLSPLYFKEYSWCREIAQRACDILQAEGYTAFLLIREENDVPLATRAERAKAYCRSYGKDNVILISVHVNAAGSGKEWKSARGWSVYTTPGITESDYVAKELFQEAQREFKEPLTVRKHSTEELGTDFEESFYILRNVPCPAVLIENFFQDNKEDVAYLKSDAGKGSCLQVIVQGIENYIAKYFKK